MKKTKQPEGKVGKKARFFFGIREYMCYHYKIIKVDGGYGHEIYNHFPKKGRKVLEGHIEVADTPYEALENATDAIDYHYD